MRKIVIVLSIFALIANSCRQTTKKQEETANEVSTETTNNSFVISCGSGCAMSYTAQNIIQNGTSINVVFEVIEYINELVSDIYYENYVFIYNKENEIQKIELKGENENVLEKLPPDAQISFKNFATNLIINILKGKIVTNNPKFDIHKIDYVKYVALKKNANIQKVELEKIDDLEQAKEILKGLVIWGKYDSEIGEIVEYQQGEIIYKVVLRSGETILLNDDLETVFVAYYPQEDILFLLGTHYYPYIYNLTTGEKAGEVGDPEYREYSPSKRYRFNGYYSGQADFYFIQEKSEEKYKTIIELDYSSGSELAGLIGFIPDGLGGVFWQNDTTMNFIAPRYFSKENKTEKFYYQLILK